METWQYFPSRYPKLGFVIDMDSLWGGIELLWLEIITRLCGTEAEAAEKGEAEYAV